MKGRSDVIEHLNKMLFNELTAINQYFLHSRMLKNWGFKALGDKLYHEAMGEMRHADRLIERILFLEGLPNLQSLGKLHVGETVPETLSADLALETVARNDTATALAFFETAADFASRDLATKILVDSEEHMDFLETQIGLLASLGEQNYLQTAVGSGEAD